ncbi:peptidyl-tRNA hydrolase-domain-containing protein [Umbelopsis sp. AD052]|nr:peptidyl-tRNA hydrolase-domain-containing protein [Umbelopsis sp. AD052]
MHTKRILIVGLGNYTHPLTRHSVGMVILDHIAEQLNMTWSLQRNWKAVSANAKFLVTDKSAKHSRSTDPVTSVTTELDITLLKPRLLMNVCGPSVAKAVADLKVPLSNLYVMHDDLQRPLAKVSLKNGGSANGHNGIKSVAKHLRTDDFKRLRIGIGRPPKDIDDRSFDVVADFVLGKLTEPEMKALQEIVYPLFTGDALNHLCLKETLTQPPKASKPPKVRKPKSASVDSETDTSPETL